jgi:anti-sigma regulatory factor (Ser/Thr protein kinase)
VGSLSTPPLAPAVEELGWYPVDGPGSAGIVKRVALDSARRLGLDEQRVAELAIGISELASNLHKHAENGWITVRCLRTPAAGAVEIVAVDSGPGMVDALSGRDGHSTTGTLGIGLGAVSRLPSHVDGYSQRGSGTVVAAQFWPAGVTPQRQRAEGLSRPLTGEKVCGDRFSVRVHDNLILLLVADGLGHGPLAAAAAAASVDAFQQTDLDAPGAIVAHVHRTVSYTRGAAISVARIDGDTVWFAGLGNVAGAIVWPDGERRGMVSMPGIAGHQARQIKEFSYPVDAHAVTVLHSDGVTDRWNVRDYPGLLRRSPLTIAATLLRDGGQRRDDACVAVARTGTTETAAR